MLNPFNYTFVLSKSVKETKYLCNPMKAKIYLVVFPLLVA